MRNIKIGLFATFLFNLAFSGMLLTAIPLYLHDKNVDVVEIGLIFSFYPLVFQLLRVLFGGLSDVFGNRKFLFFSGVMQAVTALVYLVSNTGLLYAFGKVSEGIATSALRGVERPLIFAGSERYGVGRISGYYSAAIWVSMGVGAAIAGYAIVFLGFDSVFVFTALIGLVIALLSLFVRDPQHVVRPSVVKHFLELRHANEKVKKLLLFLTLDGVAMGLVGSFALVLLLKQVYQLPTEQIGLVLLATLPVQGISAVLLGKLADKHDNKKLFFLSNTLFSLSLFAAAFAVSIHAILLVFVLCLMAMRFSDAFSGITSNRLATIHSTPKKLGRDLNFAFTGYWFGYWVGTLAAGAVIASLGYPMLFAIAGAAELALAFLMLKRF